MYFGIKGPSHGFGLDKMVLYFLLHLDEHYLGCFYEEFNDPDLPELQWGNTEGKSVDNCLKACSQLGYNFAGKSVIR